MNDIKHLLHKISHLSLWPFTSFHYIGQIHTHSLSVSLLLCLCFSVLYRELGRCLFLDQLFFIQKQHEMFSVMRNRTLPWSSFIGNRFYWKFWHYFIDDKVSGVFTFLPKRENAQKFHGMPFIYKYINSLSLSISPCVCDALLNRVRIKRTLFSWLC